MNLGLNEIQAIIKILIILCTVIAFIITFNLHEQFHQGINALKERRKNDEAQEVNIIILPSKVHNQLEEELHKPSRKYFNYERLDAFLKKNGAGYISGYFINPVNFIFIKCIIALIAFGICLLCELHLYICIIVAFISFFYLDFRIYIRNKSDNKKMLDDIQRANETIKMYGEISGTLYNAVFECYKFSENSRLKQGFFELYAELQMTHSYELSIGHFLEKFNNTYLTTLARNIEQAGTVGFNELLLDDMSRDMAELQRELNYNYKSALKTRWSVLLMFIFVSMLALCIYGMIGDFNLDLFL